MAAFFCLVFQVLRRAGFEWASFAQGTVYPTAVVVLMRLSGVRSERYEDAVTGHLELFVVDTGATSA